MRKKLEEAQRTYRLAVMLCGVWLVYLGFLGYWLLQLEGLEQVLLIVLVLPAVFQPLFWYLVLGLFLYAVTARLLDDGRKGVLPYRRNRRRPY